MNVHLTRELDQLVQAKIQSGRYNSASEVVRKALRLMEQKDEVRAIRLSRYGPKTRFAGLLVHSHLRFRAARAGASPTRVT